LRGDRARRRPGSDRRPGRARGLRTRRARAAQRIASGRHPGRPRLRRPLGRRRLRTGREPRRGRSCFLPRPAGTRRSLANGRSPRYDRGFPRARRRIASRPGPRKSRSRCARRAAGACLGSRQRQRRVCCGLPPGLTGAARVLARRRSAGGGRRRVRRSPGGAHPSLATGRKVDHPDLLPGLGHDRLGGVEQTRQRLPERFLQRGEQLGPGAESAVTLAEVLPCKLPEPLHAQLHEVVHHSSEVRVAGKGGSATLSPHRHRRLRVGGALGQRLREDVSSSGCCP
jgi:hypothetical protein